MKATLRRKGAQNVDDRVDASHEDSISTDPSRLCHGSMRTTPKITQTLADLRRLVLARKKDQP